MWHETKGEWAVNYIFHRLNNDPALSHYVITYNQTTYDILRKDNILTAYIRKELYEYKRLF